MAEWTRFLQIAFLLVTVILFVANHNSAGVEATALCKHRCDQHYQSPNMLTCSYSRTPENFFEIRLGVCNLTATATKKKRIALGYLDLENLPDKKFFSYFGADDTDDFQITYTHMQRFPFDEFLELKSKLSILGLEYNGISEWGISKTTDVSQLLFASTLTRLYLDGNSLSYLPDGAFNAFPLLKTLNLPRNKISHIRAGIFSMSQNWGLTTLVLRDNNIMYIDLGALDKLTSLVKLDLSGNKLAALDAGTISTALFTSIKDIRLGGNPFFGYSFNKWLLTGMNTNADVLLYSNATCTRPTVGDFATVLSSATLPEVTLTISPIIYNVTSNPANA